MPTSPPSPPPPPPPPSPPPPPPPTISQIIILLLKILMFAFLLASLAVLVSDTATVSLTLFSELKIQFDDIYTYRYVLASIVMGLVYSLLQTAFSSYHIAMGSPLIAGDVAFAFDFFGDKVISYILATGSAAGFGATKDLKAVADALKVDDFDDFFDKAYASASLLLLAFVCAAILSVFSSYALPKMAASTS